MHMPDHDGVFARHGLPWRLRVTGTLMSVVDCNGNIVVSDDHAGAEAVGELIIDAVNAYPDIQIGAALWDEPGP